MVKVLCEGLPVSNTARAQHILLLPRSHVTPLPEAL